MNIGKDTKICISVSQNPGNFGATIHNELYKKFNLDYIYLPLSTKNIKNTISWVRNTPNVVGCSVSMPYKKEALFLVDQVILPYDTDNINTIIKKEDKLIGFSTDCYAIENICKSNAIFNKNVLIYGTGAMANNFKLILEIFGNTVTLVARGQKYFETIKQLGINVFINATPCQEVFFNEIMDLVIECPVTQKNHGYLGFSKKFIRGWELSLIQTSYQFQLYTGVNYEEAYYYAKKAIELWKE